MSICSLHLSFCQLKAQLGTLARHDSIIPGVAFLTAQTFIYKVLGFVKPWFPICATY